MAYQLGNYTFKTAQELQAAKRDLAKIQAVKKAAGPQKDNASACIKQIRASNIKFETAVGRDYIKSLAARAGGSSKPAAGDKTRFYGSGAPAKKGKKPKKEGEFASRPRWQKVSMIMLGIIMAVLLAVLGHELYGDFISRENVEELRAVANSVTEESFDVDEMEALEASGVQVLSWDGKQIRPQFRKLVLQNPDFAGWLTIAGTKVDYPVMHRQDDNDFYLSHNFEGEYDVNGLLILDKRCSVDGTDDNVLIHGHNMKSGFMFGALRNYKSEDFYKEHPTIKFDSLYQENVYDIIAVFLSSVDRNSGTDFKYYDYISITNEAVFDAYINGIKAQSLYDIPYSAKYGDHLISLSTCDYTKRDGRLVVVGRKRFVS
ncbi:MAG: class B sortase [Lachnospiraceae bacterium]|nr:class B sortase [Lachnospiraceae bacterium]